MTQANATATYQTTLNASITLSGIGSNLTLINYSNLSNIPVDLLTSNSASNIFLTSSSLPANLLTSNSASNIFLTSSSLPANLLTSNSASNIFLTSASLPANLLTSNSASNIFLTSSSLPANLLTSNTASNIFLTQASATATYQPTLNASTSLLGIGSNLTLINYSNLSNIPVGLITSNDTSNIFLTQASATATYQPILAINSNINISNINCSNLTASNNLKVNSNISTSNLIVSANTSSLNYVEGGTLLTSKYLQLSGGNITGNLGLNTTTNVSGILLDCRGSIYTYGISIIDSATISGNNVMSLQNFQLMIIPPKASTAASIQTIRQGVDFNQNLTLQAISGNVGIGLTNPSSTLHVNGTMNATTIQENGTLLTSKYLQLSGGNITGNLGIGTATPGYKLDVNGNARIYNGSITTDFYIGNGNASSALNLWDIAGAAWRIYTYSSNLYFTNGTVGGTLNQKFYADFNGYLYLGGGANLRLGGNDATNTIYSPAAANIGITLNYATNASGSINLGFNGGNGNILSITNTAATVSQKLIVNNNVGIGTTNPTQTLDVYSDSTTANQYIRVRANPAKEAGIIFDRTGGYWAFFSKGTGFGASSNNLCVSSGSVSSVLEITQSGNFGIGTNNPTSLLMVYGGDITVSSLVTSSLNTVEQRMINNISSFTNVYSGDLLLNSFWGVAINLNAGGLGDVSQASSTKIVSSSSFTINTRTTSTIANGFDKTLFTVRNSGSVGIGTTNPTSTLHINAGAILKVISLYDLGNNYQYTGFGATSGLIHNIPSTSDAFQFRVGTSSTAANEVMRITGGGNIGIGTNNPTSKLHINTGPILKVISLYDLGNDYQYTGFGSTSGLIHNIPSTSDAFQFRVGTSSTAANEVMRITGGGNVGIGTNAPNASLELYSTSRAQARLILSGQQFYDNTGLTTGGIAFLAGVNTLGNRQLWIADSANLTQNATNPVIRIMPNQGGITYPCIDAIATDGSTRLIFGLGNAIIILPNGNVGIGITNPSSTLQVNGTLNATTIQENGTALTSKYLLQTTASTTYQTTLAINSNINISNINSSNIYNSNLTTTSNLVVSTTASANSFIENGTSLSSKYLNSNILPNLNKKNGFVINCSNLTTLNGTNYYKYDINLSSYTRMLYLDGASNLPYRTFSIKCLPVSGIFSLNGDPQILQYDIYMSSNISGGTSNICAIGVPQNINLNQIPVSSSLFLLQTTIFNYISVISTTSANINCIIEDYLN